MEKFSNNMENKNGIARRGMAALAIAGLALSMAACGEKDDVVATPGSESGVVEVENDRSETATGQPAEKELSQSDSTTPTIGDGVPRVVRAGGYDIECIAANDYNMEGMNKNEKQEITEALVEACFGEDYDSIMHDPDYGWNFGIHSDVYYQEYENTKRMASPEQYSDKVCHIQLAFDGDFNGKEWYDVTSEDLTSADYNIVGNCDEEPAHR